MQVGGPLRAGRYQPLTLPKLSQETLAEMVGTTRSRVNFFMNKFRELGFIEYNARSRSTAPAHGRPSRLTQVRFTNPSIRRCSVQFGQAARTALHSTPLTDLHRRPSITATTVTLTGRALAQNAAVTMTTAVISNAGCN